MLRSLRAKRRRWTRPLGLSEDSPPIQLPVYPNDAPAICHHGYSPAIGVIDAKGQILYLEGERDTISADDETYKMATPFQQYNAGHNIRLGIGRPAAQIASIRLTTRIKQASFGTAEELYVWDYDALDAEEIAYFDGGEAGDVHEDITTITENIDHYIDPVTYVMRVYHQQTQTMAALFCYAQALVTLA